MAIHNEKFTSCVRCLLLLPLMLIATLCGQTWQVASDGSAPFTTIQQAVDAAPSRATETIEIRIKAGVYRGHVTVPSDKPHLALIGENAQTTIITDDKNVYSLDPNGQKLSTKRSATLAVDADFFSASQLTIANTAGNHGQALALYANGDGTSLRNCRMLGWQDTLRVERGRHYVADCWIEGHCDFIYGNGTAVFDRCQIDCLESGYITAASTAPEREYGFVFLDCRITARAAAKKVYLGRPWRPGAQVMFLNCELPASIVEQGWHNWSDPVREKTARYAEYRSKGKGANAAKRVSWSRQLTEEEAQAVTLESVFQLQDASSLRSGGRWPRAAAVAAGQGSAPLPPGTRVLLVGDSTVTDHAGWGRGFASALPPGFVCINRAKGGESSKSFRDSGAWERALAERPQYVLIQFGHNDMPGKGPSRETTPATTFRENLRWFVAAAREQGAKPVLVTSLTRRHFRQGQVVSDLVDYAAETAKLAQELNVSLIDLHAHSCRTCQQLGPEGCNRLSPIDPKTGRIDATHLNSEGSTLFGSWVGKQFIHLVAAPK